MFHAYLNRKKAVLVFDYKVSLSMEDALQTRALRQAISNDISPLIVIVNFDPNGRLEESRIPFIGAQWVKEDAHFISEFVVCGIKGLHQLFYKSYISFFKRSDKPLHRSFKNLSEAERFYNFSLSKDFEKLS